MLQAGAPFKFAPDEGPAFLERAGWKPVDVRSLLHTAAALGRLSWGMRLASLWVARRITCAKTNFCQPTSP